MEIRIKGEENKEKKRYNIRCPKTGKFLKASPAPSFYILSTDAYRIGCQGYQAEEPTKQPTNIQPNIPIYDIKTIHFFLIISLITFTSLIKLFG